MTKAATQKHATAARKKPGTVTPNAKQRNWSSGIPANALVTPANGPGHTMKPLGKLDAPSTSPIRNSTTSGEWSMPKWEAARPDAEAHKLHGSMRNGEVHPWSQPLSMCIGVAAPVMQSGTQRRFA